MAFTAPGALVMAARSVTCWLAGLSGAVPSVGARVSIATDAEHLHLFEATSGSRIEP